MPELVELHEAHEGKGVRVVAVSVDLVSTVRVDTAEGIGDFAAKRNFGHLDLVAFNGDLRVLTARLESSGALPYTVAIDDKGRIVDTQLGMAGRSRFEEMIEKAR